MIQVYRYGDKITIFLKEDQKKGIYLTIDDARRLVHAINECARDITEVSYSRSTFKTIDIDVKKIKKLKD